jgi:hypothetical protein
MKNSEQQLLQKLQELAVINPNVLNRLPLLYKEIFETQKFSVLQDALLITTITASASIGSNLYCVHDKKLYHPNLSVLVVAPFASGKAVMMQIRKYFKGIDKKLKNIYEADLRVYKQALRDYKENKQNGDGSMEEPIKPTRVRAFLPSNASSAAMIRNINDNGGKGIILETEASTVAVLFQSDWANFKDVLLKNAMNEDIEFSRKLESYTIEAPHVSLALSTTPQLDILNSIFADGSDGLISRVMVYYYETSREWNKDVFIANGWREFSDQSDEFSERFLRIHDNLERFSKIIVEWKPSQSAVLNPIFERLLDDSKNSHGEGSVGLIFRLGLTTTRIATVLAIVRLMDKPFDQIAEALNYIYGDELIINPTDDDLACAVNIIIAIRQHVLALFDGLQQGEHKLIDMSNRNVAKLYDLLPEAFSRKRALEIGKPAFNVQDRAIDKYLSLLVEGNLLEKDNKGNYTKIK